MTKTLSGRLSGALLGALVSLPLMITFTSSARADGLRDAYTAQCLPAARKQLGKKYGPRVSGRLCECAADRAEASGWVLPEFPARDAEACLEFATGFAAVSPFAAVGADTQVSEARSAPARTLRVRPRSRSPRSRITVTSVKAVR
jgi:hypothetical protein